MAKHVSELLGFVSVALAMLTLEQPAYAYIDPGTGSMLLQVLLGGVAGAFVIAKVYWKGLVARFGIRGRTPESSKGNEVK